MACNLHHMKKQGKYNLLTSHRQRSDPERGIGFVETLTALAIFAVVAVVFLSAITTNDKSRRVVIEKTVARNLASTVYETIRNETVFRADYSSVTSLIPVPAGYQLTIEYRYSPDGGSTWSETYDDTALQRLQIFVSENGTNKEIINMCAYKMRL